VKQLGPWMVLVPNSLYRVARDASPTTQVWPIELVVLFPERRSIVDKNAWDAW
jgi:hypothetical protein